jgi:hypothetical protein
MLRSITPECAARLDRSALLLHAGRTAQMVMTASTCAEQIVEAYDEISPYSRRAQ